VYLGCVAGSPTDKGGGMGQLPRGGRPISGDGATMGHMATLGDRILEAIRYAPLDDDMLARRLGVPQRQSVNQAARRLEAQGLLRRIPGPDGKIVNALPADATHEPTSTSRPSSEGPSTVRQLPPTPTPSRARFAGDRITEDEVKEAVRAYLAADGFMGRGRLGSHAGRRHPGSARRRP
jgi:hypothetical protein